MKKFISLVLALVMALSLTTAAWGAVAATDAAKIGDTGYATLADAVTNATAGDEIVLLKDVADGVGIVIDKKLTIDFGGYTYTFASNPVGSSGTKTLGFQILDTAVAVTLKNGTLTSKAGSGVKMLVQNYCDLTLDGMTLIGTNLDGGGKYVLSNNAGDIVIEDTTITAAADGVAFDSYDYSAGGYTTPPTVTVKGTSVVNGTVESAGGKLVVENGTFNGDIDVTNAADVTVKGGTFTDDVSDYVADGKAAISTDGKFVIATKTTSGSGSETTLKDKDGYDIYAVDGTTSVKAADADITRKITGNAIASNGTVTYTATTYSDGANVYVEVDSSVADFKLMKGNTIVAYLVNLSSVGDIPTTTKTVSSYVKAVKDAKCGQYSETIYPAGVYMIGGKAYAADAGNSWALYNGKFVNYGGEATAVSHTYAVNTYNTTDRSVTTLKCSVCKQVFTVLTPAQVKTMAPSAYAQVTADGGTYFIAVASATAGTNGGTVNSADTFDAGIAMYVGMSVMAAAGSAVVLKKKKD